MSQHQSRFRKEIFNSEPEPFECSVGFPILNHEHLTILPYRLPLPLLCFGLVAGHGAPILAPLPLLFPAPATPTLTLTLLSITERQEMGAPATNCVCRCCGGGFALNSGGGSSSPCCVAGCGEPPERLVGVHPIAWSNLIIITLPTQRLLTAPRIIDSQYRKRLPGGHPNAKLISLLLTAMQFLS